LFEASSHQETALRGKFAHEEFKHGGLGVAVIEIRLDHVQVVKIGK
jgi:hypothetical protein